MRLCTVGCLIARRGNSLRQSDDLQVRSRGICKSDGRNGAEVKVDLRWGDRPFVVSACVKAWFPDHGKSIGYNGRARKRLCGISVKA